MIRSFPFPAVLLFAAICAAHVASACQVPVFRYALERWQADPHVIVVAHADPLSEAQSKLVRRMEDEAWRSNIEVVQLDVADEKAAAEFPEIEADGGAYPRMAAYYPHGTGHPVPYWQGSFDGTNVDRLLDSPMRQQLLRKITEGDSAIWLLIESGDKAKDDAAEARLEEMLETAGDGLQVPEGVITAEEAESVLAAQQPVDAKDILQSTIPLHIAFSILRMSQEDIAGAEAILHPMIMAIEPETMKAVRESPEPVIAPVFGKGRMLPGIPASVVDEDAVWAACQYLCGECSCEVKEENPGFDLLLSAEWDEILDGNYVIMEKVLPPLTGTGDLVAGVTGEIVSSVSAPVPEKPWKAGPSPDERASAQAMKRNVFLFGGIFAAVVVGASLVIRKQGGS